MLHSPEGSTFFRHGSGFHLLIPFYGLVWTGENAHLAHCLLPISSTGIGAFLWICDDGLDISSLVRFLTFHEDLPWAYFDAKIASLAVIGIYTDPDLPFLLKYTVRLVSRYTLRMNLR